MANMVTLICDGCTETFDIKKSQYEYEKRVRNRDSLACSRECSRYVLHGYPKSNIVCRNCEGCGTLFSRKRSAGEGARFCSRSCSNRKHGENEVVVEKSCIRCHRIKPIGRRMKMCDDCRVAGSTKSDYKSLTVGDLRDKYSTHQFHAKIRGAARAVFRQSGLPMECVNCGYSLHVDICHIKPVASFPPETTIDEVNSLSNLVTLDKRCHWEFDNGYLDASDFGVALRDRTVL